MPSCRMVSSLLLIGGNVANVGIAPPDYSTPIGEMRQLIGDTEYEPIDGQPEYGDYNNFSDAEISLALKLGDDDELWAAAFLYAKLAASISGDASSNLTAIKSDDLSLTISSHSGGLWDTARWWLDLWSKRQADATVEYHNFVQITPERIVEPELNHYARVRPWGSGAAHW